MAKPLRRDKTVSNTRDTLVPVQGSSGRRKRLAVLTRIIRLPSRSRALPLEFAWRVLVGERLKPYLDEVGGR